MYFPDLGTETQIVAGPYVRAVGWLDSRQAWLEGPVGPDARERIRVFAASWHASVQALGWPIAMGPHFCGFCGERKFGASGNFGVPGGDVLYVCPQMLHHYVEAHRYLPPLEFLDAIQASPFPGTDAYAAAVAPFRGWEPPPHAR